MKESSKLDIYYINFDNPENIDGFKMKKLLEDEGNKNLVLKTLGGISSSAKYIQSNIKKLVNSVNDAYLKSFNAISSPEELENFINANGNEWKVLRKGELKSQFYIKHPKIKTENILIEAYDFASYIEKEHKSELINYILSHCKAKKIYIDKLVKSDIEGKSNGKFLKKYSFKVDTDIHSISGDFYKLERNSGVMGIKLQKPFKNYYWLDDYLKDSIDALSNGGILEQKYFMDYKFGLNAKICSEIGMDMKNSKSYQYNIYIEA